MASQQGAGGPCPEVKEECEADSMLQRQIGTSRCYGTLSSPSKAVDDSLKLDLLADQDSGFPGSSSMSGNKNNSFSASDSNDDSDDRSDMFGYRPFGSEEREYCRIRSTLNADHDESFRVDSSTGGSPVESPRSETSATQEEYNLSHDIEMQELRHDRQRQSDDEDDGTLTSIKTIPHQHLYGASRRQGDFSDGFREFDPLQNTHYINQQLSPLDSQRAKTLNKSYNCYKDPILRAVPGSLTAQQHKANVSSKSASLSNDDNDKLLTPGGLDVNGNPPVDLSHYSQMRQSVGAGTLSSQQPELISSSQTPSSAPEQPQLSDLERKKLRRQKKQEKQKKGELKSEEFEDFKGNQEIDDLLTYIEGGNSHKKIGQATPSSATSQQIPNGPSKGDKPKKKLDKKKETVTEPEERVRVDVADCSSAVTAQSSTAMGATVIKDSPDNDTPMSNGPTPPLPRTHTATNGPTPPFEEITTASHTVYQNTVQNVNSQNSLSSKDEKKEVNTSNTYEHKNSGSLKKSISVETIDIENHIENNLPQGDKKTAAIMKTHPKKHKDSKEISENHTPAVNSVSSNRKLKSEHKIPNVNGDVEGSRSSTCSFIEVKKKKKQRVLPKDNFVSNTNLPTQPFVKGNYYHGTVYTASAPPPQDSTAWGNNGLPYSHGKWRLKQESYQNGPSNDTKAMTYNQAIKISEVAIASGDGSVSRDLSPSSFPVLNCHTGPTLGPVCRERRNSCGDINDMIAIEAGDMRSVCDSSDRESVKSLPAAPRKLGGGSNGGAMSYASMVAAQHHHGNSPSSESGIVCEDSQASSVGSCQPHLHDSMEAVSPHSTHQTQHTATTPDRKTTVWKGSPRERRHSIGSSPEENKPETDISSSAARNRQKSGSQECLALVLTTSASLPSDAMSAVQADNHPKPIPSQSPSAKDEAGHFIPTDQSLPLRQTVPMEGGDNETKCHVDSPSPSSVSSKVPSSVSSLAPSSLKASTVSDTPVGLHIPQSDRVENPVAESTIKKSGNSQPVTFLDRRFGGERNLGITFGFDSSMDSPCSSSSSLSLQPTPSQPVSRSHTSSSSSSSQQKTAVPLQTTVFNIPAPNAPAGSSKRLASPSYNTVSSKIVSHLGALGSETKSIPADKSCPLNGLVVPRSASVSANDCASTGSVTSVSNLSEQTQQKPTDSLRSASMKTVDSHSVDSISRPPPSQSERLVPGMIIPPQLPAMGIPPSFIGQVPPEFSPRYPPPPIHHHYTVSMPPLQMTMPVRPAMAQQVQEPASISASSAVSPAIASSSSRNSSSSSQSTVSAKNVPEDSLPPGVIRVVYGLKLKSGGCGQLLFRPPQPSLAKASKANKAEVSNLLKKKWSEATKRKDEGKYADARRQ